MTIERFTLPLSSPLRTATGTIDSRQGFVVRYEHRGEIGLGEATPLAGWTESVSSCRVALEAALETAASTCHESALLDLEVSDTPAARHGFTTAVLDADAKAEGVPFYKWLDDDRDCESVPVNATIGDANVEETRAAARKAVGDGFTCMKVKAGARSAADDVERLRAVREAISDDVALRVDANGSWSRTEARMACKALGELDVTYVEQPLPSEDLEGLAGLSGGPVDVAVDESLIDQHVTDIIEAGAADVLIIKPMILGGPGNAYAVAMHARNEGIEPVVTTTIDAVIARTAAVHVAGAIPDVAPCGVATGRSLAADLGPDPVPVEDGEVPVPQVPGLGVAETEGEL